MIRRRPTGYIRRPYDYSNGDTEDIEFIRCVDGRDPQLHEMWCLSLDNVIRKIYPTAQIEVGAGTVGELTTNYLAENGRRILIIGQISINISVQFLGIPNFSVIVDCYFVKTCKIPLCSSVGDTLIPPIITVELCRGDLKSMSQSPGVVTYLTVRLTCVGFRLNRALLCAAYVMTYFVVGIASVWGVPPKVVILSSIWGSIVVVTIGRVRLLNTLCCKIPLLFSVTFYFPSLLWVTVFRLLAGSPFVSFTFAESDA